MLMPTNRFEPGTLIEIDGVDHRPTGHAAGRQQLLDVVTGAYFVDRGATGMPTDDEFSAMLEQGRVRIKGPRSADRIRLLNESAEWALDQAIAIDPSVGKRLAQVQLLDAAGVANGDKAIAVHLARFWTPELVEKHGPHDPPRTIRRWRTTRGRPGGRRPNHMVSMRGRAPRASRSPDVAAEVEWKHALAAQQTRGRPHDAYAEYRVEMAAINAGTHSQYAKPTKPYRIVSKETMRRRCNALECSATVRTKLGEEAVEQDWSGGGRSLVADFAMHMVIVDHTRIDVFVVDDEFEMVLGRAWLSLAVCVATRTVVAHLLSFNDPSVWTLGEILRRMALPKRVPPIFADRYPILRDLRGKPTELIVDNAVEFKSHTMEAAARSAGFNVRFCPIRRPRYRAIGERTIGTIVRMICEALPGRTLPIAEARRFGHDAEDEACVLMRELEAVTVHCIAEYNTSPHSELGDRQPALMFEKDAKRFGINAFADLEAFRIDVMAIHTGAQLTPSGIRTFGGLRHHDIAAVRGLLDDLVPLEGRRRRRDDATATVDYRYDPQDIKHIYVWNRKTLRYVRLTCSDERYADGMPLAFHEQIRRAAKAEGAAFNTEDERCLARTRRIQAIRAIDPKELARSRKAVAELYEIPRLRQITGNIVHLHHEPSTPVTLDDFLPNDRAALTALDNEILSQRPEVKPRTTHRNLRARRDQRDAGRMEAADVEGPAKSDQQTASTSRRRRRSTTSGSYE